LDEYSSTENMIIYGLDEFYFDRLIWLDFLKECLVDCVYSLVDCFDPFFIIQIHMIHLFLV